MPAKTHGMSESSEYKIWLGIKYRCYNKLSQYYEYYGGRGIEMCDEWINSFESFYNDMGNKPNGDYSLDRINNDLGYFKENCRWATNKQQSLNRRSNIRITYNGKTLTLKEWSVIFNIPYKRLHKRVHFFKWPFEDAISGLKFKGSRYYKSRENNGKFWVHETDFFISVN